MAEALHSVLGVDYGTRKTGVAISRGGFAPRPLQVLKTERPWANTAKAVARIADEENVEGIVVGFPCVPTGRICDRNGDTAHGRRCRHFASYLAAVLEKSDRRVYLFDEFRTSRDADLTFEATYFDEGALDVYTSLEVSRSRSRNRRKKLKKHGWDANAAAILLKRYYQTPSQALEVS